MNQDAKAKETAGESLKSGKILLWTSIGPILLLLTALIGSLEQSAFIPWLGGIAVLSALTVFFLDFRGALLSALLFGSALSYQWVTHGFTEGPFLFLLAISYFLGVLVFALGLSESRALFDEIEKESKSRLSALWKLEEKARNEEKRFGQELAKQQKTPADHKDQEKEQLLKKLQKELEDARGERETCLKQLQELTEKLESANADRHQEEERELKAKEDHEAALNILKNELAEANQLLQDHESEEIRQRTVQKEMSSMIERLTEEQEVLTEALVKGEAMLQSQQEKGTALQKAVEDLEEKLLQKEEKFNSLSQELQQIGHGYKEKEFVLRGIVQEANARNAQLERELKELRSKSPSAAFSQESLDAKENELKELKEKHAELTREIAEHKRELQQAEVLKERVKGLENEKELLLSERQHIEALTAAKDSEVHTLKDQLQSLQDQLLKQSEEYKIAAEERGAFEEKLAALQEERDQFSQKHTTLQSFLEDKNEEITSLQNELKLHIERAEAAEVVIEGSPKDMKKKLDAALKERDKFKEILGELKGLRKEDTKKFKEVQAQLKQLKQQFEDKSQALDDSRKSLFHMQEKLLILQRESEDRPASDRSEVERLLEKQIGKMERERKQLLSEHQEEVTALQEIIDALSSRQPQDALTT